jgi:hypothetical protein
MLGGTAFVLAAAALGIVVAEPGGDFVACALEETAILARAALASLEALVAPARTLVARVVPVISHTRPPTEKGQPRGRREPLVKTILRSLPFLSKAGAEASNRPADLPLGQVIARAEASG